MKALMLIAGVISLTIVLSGLFDSETTGAESSGEGSANGVTRQAKDAADAARRSTIEKKDELERQVRIELETIQGEIRSWQGKTQAMSDEARAELERAIKRLEMRKELARRKLEDLRQTTTSTWARWQEGMVQTLDDLKRAYRDAVAALP